MVADAVYSRAKFVNHCGASQGDDVVQCISQMHGARIVNLQHTKLPSLQRDLKPTTSIMDNTWELRSWSLVLLKF